MKNEINLSSFKIKISFILANVHCVILDTNYKNWLNFSIQRMKYEEACKLLTPYKI